VELNNQNTPRAADCPSDYALDQYRVQLLAPDALARIERHLPQCPGCQTRLEYMTAGFDAEPDLDPRRILASARRKAADVPAPWWQRLSLWVPVLAVGGAAALLLMAQPTGPGLEPSIGEGLRAKGGLALHVIRADSQEALSGATFTAGERVRFKVDLPSAGQLTIIGIEANGQAYPVWPLTPNPRQTPAGDAQLLSGAFAFDAASGTETLHLTLCSTAARCVVNGGQLACPDTCLATPFTVVKAP
jgi:hypothetical protein